MAWWVMMRLTRERNNGRRLVWSGLVWSGAGGRDETGTSYHGIGLARYVRLAHPPQRKKAYPDGGCCFSACNFAWVVGMQKTDDEGVHREKTESCGVISSKGAWPGPWHHPSRVDDPQ